jgi:hypothetical protein
MGHHLHHNIGGPHVRLTPNLPRRYANKYWSHSANWEDKIRSGGGGGPQLQNLAKACGSGQPTFTLFSYTNTHLSLLKKIPGKPKTMHASMHGWVHVCVLEKPNNQTCKHSRTVMSLMQMAGVILVKAHYAVFEFFARRLLALSPSSYRLELWICLYVYIYTPPLEHLQRSCKRGSRSS